MNQISAKVICDSINSHNDRIVTVECVVPRIVLAEFNTHRMFSRNSASSRAIPAAKMRQMILDGPFVPIKWMKEHKGMQGTDYFEGSDATAIDFIWRMGSIEAVERSAAMSEGGLTKQLANRIIEPYMYHKILLTSTDFENFTALRAEGAAEIHIQDFAYKLIEALNTSVPKSLMTGQWHIPYGDEIDMNKLADADWSPRVEDRLQELKLKIATARCAQVSYIIIGEDGKPMDYHKLILLHDRLAGNGHVSPMEHCAQTMTEKQYESSGMMVYNPETDEFERQNGWCKNYRGFIQYRAMLKGENRTDSRITKRIYQG